MRKHTSLLAVAAAAAAAVALAGGCSKMSDGDVVIKRPSGVTVTTTQDTVHMPRLGSRLDTINAPVVGTQKETLIVNKPFVGTEKRVVRVPTIKRP